jgi:DNA repair photolyase
MGSLKGNDPPGILWCIEMIISASRRTDIPGFYSKWFMNRIRAGYCLVPNPFNPNQVTRVSLILQDVDVIVFWTRSARPLLRYLRELEGHGYKYYFQYTVMDNPRVIDVRAPALEVSIRTFQKLADHVGPDRVIWRYDPIVFTPRTGTDFHRQTYERIARRLKGHTRRSVISVLDVYRKSKQRLDEWAAQGYQVLDYGEEPSDRYGELMRAVAGTAAANDMEVVSCAEKDDLRTYGIRQGKCVDDELIARVLGITVHGKKDPAQRKACGCVVSKDIGMYDTCLFGCGYCYATKSLEQARMNYKRHDPDSPSLIEWFDTAPYE